MVFGPCDIVGTDDKGGDVDAEVVVVEELCAGSGASVNVVTLFGRAEGLCVELWCVGSP